MKKPLLFLTLIIVFNQFVSRAQLDYGDLAPDWTYTDINGNSWNLYSMLDSGKTVFIDYSAAWCAPCWNYHNSGALKNLYNQYGPPGTDEVRVFFFEGETDNTSAQLLGTNTPSNACSSSDPAIYYSGCSKGNWVAGEPYVFVDLPDATFRTNYKTSAFPTIFAICPNRVIRELSSGLNANQLKAAAVCPPAATFANDPAVLFYKGTTITCGNTNLKITLQNNGTSPLNACTITATQNGNQVAQINWTGNLPNKYDATQVTIGTTIINADENINISITSADDNTSNNSLTQMVKYRTPEAVPYLQDFETSIIAQGWNRGIKCDEYGWYDAASAYGQAIGGYNTSSNSIVELFYYIGSGQKDTLFTTQFDLTNATNAKLLFDVAYAQYSNQNDKLEVKVSTNCSAATPAWSTKYSKAGAALKTADPTTSDFIPDNTQWRTDTVDLSSYGGQLISMAFIATSAYGNNLYLDNIRIVELVAGMADFEKTELPIQLYPNPSSGTVFVNTFDAKNVSITIYNVLGEIVHQYEMHTSETTIDLSHLPHGIYSVNFTSETSSVIKKIALSK